MSASDFKQSGRQSNEIIGDRALTAWEIASVASSILIAEWILASAMGWRLLEPYLLSIGGIELEFARTELNELHRLMAGLPIDARNAGCDAHTQVSPQVEASP